jgi:uncharacterized membrane protein HdeD (DUF308 family)
MKTNTLFGVSVGEEPVRERTSSRRWAGYLFLGIALIIAGCVGLSTPVVMTLASVIAYGWLLLVGGLFETGAAVSTRQAPGFPLRLLAGVLSILAGGVLIVRPGLGALTLALVLAGFFLIGGLFRIATALALKLPGWGWMFTGGAISTLLGVLIWAEWPVSGLWVVGLFVAIEIVNRGWAWVMYALAERG